MGIPGVSNGESICWSRENQGVRPCSGISHVCGYGLTDKGFQFSAVRPFVHESRSPRVSGGDGCSEYRRRRRKEEEIDFVVDKRPWLGRPLAIKSVGLLQGSFAEAVETFLWRRGTAIFGNGS